MQSNSKSKLKKIIVSILAVIVVIIGIITTTKSVNSKNSYAAYTSDHPYTNLKDHSNLDKINYTIVFKTGCKHCEQARKSIIPNLKKLEMNHTPFTVTDANNANNNVVAFLNSKNIDQTPTILVQYKTYTLYSYTGTDDAIINTLFSGLNPDNMKAFKAEKPKYSIFKNQFTKNYTKQPVSDPN